MKKYLFLLITLFLVSCDQNNDSEKQLLKNKNWPQVVEGEIVIADAITDDTGVISAIGWVEPEGSSDKIGIVFKSEVLKTIDLNQNPEGMFKVWLNPPKDREFEVFKVEKL